MTTGGRGLRGTDLVIGDCPTSSGRLSESESSSSTGHTHLQGGGCIHN